VPVLASRRSSGAFYGAPASLPATPGALLRSEPLPRGVSAGAQAWRILYTTRDDTTPAIASDIVLAATQVPAGPRPVVAWTHGTTGVAAHCAPSLLDDPFGAPALDQVIAQGVADEVVAAGVTDQFVRDRCAAGQSLEYRTYAGRDHNGVVAPESRLNADLSRWTQDRLAGTPPTPGCQTIPE